MFYSGLGMLMVGLVITGVGLGEKGFKSIELKLVGPIIVGFGCLVCLVSVLMCTSCGGKLTHLTSCCVKRKISPQKDPEVKRPVTFGKDFDTMEVELKYGQETSQAMPGSRLILKPLRLINSDDDKLYTLQSRDQNTVFGNNANYQSFMYRKENFDHLDEEFWPDIRPEKLK